MKELPKTFGVANTERLLDDFGKKIAETLLRYMMFLGFCIGNYITNLLQQLYSWNLSTGISPWIKLSWHCGSMWDKLGWLNRFWQFICDGSSSFNPKGFYYSFACSCNLCEGRTSFCTGLISRKLYGLLLMFSTGFTPLSVFFFLYQSPCLPLPTVFDSISSNISSLNQPIC